MSVFEFVCLNKLVIVSVDERVRVVVEDSTRNVVDVAPIVFALLVCLRRL